MSTSTVKDSFTVAKGWRKRGGGRLKPMNTTQTKVRSTEEALKLALEALENLINQHYAETTTNDDLEKADNAITAIKEALAQPAVAEQHKQEPVGEMRESAVIEGMIVPVVEIEVPVGTKLYTEAPYVPTERQRTWVGLTDEERKQLWGEWENGHVVEATEAKLKEKNNGT